MAEQRISKEDAEKFRAEYQGRNLGNGIDKDGPKTIELLCAKDIRPEPIDWVWKGWIAHSKVQILAGPVGSGKSTVAFCFAATVSTGGKWPDGTTATQGNVLIWSGEDDKADTIVPRLIAAEADLNRIFIISTVTQNGVRRPFDPSVDLIDLDEELRKITGGVALLIIDPLVSAIEKKRDSHKNAETRQGLQHVIDFVQRHRCALIGIHHLTKGTTGHEPVERLTGSLAFGAIARIVLMTMKPNADTGGPPRLLVRAKSNIGPDGGGFGYEIQTMIPQGDNAVEASFIKWLDPIAGEARDLIAEAEHAEKSDEQKQPALTRAIVFLSEILKEGAVPSEEVRQKADEAGYSWDTIKRAKTRMGVISQKEPKQDGRWWTALFENQLPFSCETPRARE